MNNQNRQGRFTSSQMYKIVGTPAVLKTYITEKQIEKRMQRCLDTGSYSQAMAWGRFMELRVFQLMGTEYTIVSKETIVHTHKELEEFWSGSPDMIAFKGNYAFKVSEVKCYYPKAFALLTDAMKLAEETGDLSYLKNVKTSSGKGREYWQVVSNAILCGVDEAEIITYMPKQKEMKEIREDVADYDFDSEDYWQYGFIHKRGDDVLPVLPNNGHYDSLNVFTFTVPEEDKELLTNAVLEASKML